MVTVLHLNLASLPWNSRSALMIKNQRDWEALLKGGIKTILNSMECHKAAPSSALIWSQQITFPRRLPPMWGKQQAACWILAARASVNKGNKLQLRLPQGLKWSLHIKHRVSFGWRDAEELRWPLWGWWGRRGGDGSEDDNQKKKRKDTEVILSFRRLQVITFFSPHRKLDKRQKCWTTYKHTHKQTLCFSLLNAAGKSHTAWKDSAVSLQVIFLP